MQSILLPHAAGETSLQPLNPERLDSLLSISPAEHIKVSCRAEIARDMGLSGLRSRGKHVAAKPGNTNTLYSISTNDRPLVLVEEADRHETVFCIMSGTNDAVMCKIPITGEREEGSLIKLEDLYNQSRSYLDGQLHLVASNRAMEDEHPSEHVIEQVNRVIGKPDRVAPNRIFCAWSPSDERRHVGMVYIPASIGFKEPSLFVRSSQESKGLVFETVSKYLK